MANSDNINNNTKSNGVVLISQAADILGVSIDTVRRWDKAGTISSTRPDGKNRYFSVEELEKVKLEQPLLISEAAQMLKVSASTLRRLEKRGLIVPIRNGHGERRYDRKTLENFLDSEYFIRQKEVEEEVLEPLKPAPSIEELEPQINQPGVELAIKRLISEHHINIRKLRERFGLALGISAAILTPVFILVGVLTTAFLVSPESTAKKLSLDYASITNSPNMVKAASTDNTQDPAQLINSDQIKYKPNAGWKDNLRPLVNVALFLVKQVDSQKYATATKDLQISDVNSIFQPRKDGGIQSLYTLSLGSNQLNVSDQGLVFNLNSDLLHGKRPGNSAGDIAVLPLSGGLGGAITDASITTVDIANGAITSNKLASNISLNVDQITTTNGLTIGNSLTLTTGALNLTATSGTLNLSGLSASSISTGTNNLTITSSNFNTTATGINSTAIGVTTPAAGNFITIGATTTGTGAFTTISASGQITSTLADGTAPLVVASSTNIANLNASSLNGATFAAPGPIGSGTPSTGAFTTLSAASLAIASITDSSLATAGVVTNTATGVLGTLAGTSTTILHGNAAGLPTFSSVVGGDLAANITISTTGNIATTGAGTITSAGPLTASNGLTLTTGALNLTATSGTLTLSGLSASSISAGANGLTFTSSNFNTTATGINSTAIGATTTSTGAFTTLSSTGLSVVSANVAGLTTSSSISLSANSLTTGTGLYAASSSLTSGLLANLQVSGTAAAASQTALNILTTGANGTAGITTYGAQISNTHSTNTSTNVALYLNASGGATANYGLIVNAGYVGIGTPTPTTAFDVAGLTLNTDATNSVAAANFAGTITKNDANTITFNGVQIKPTLNTGASNTTTTFNVLNIDTTNTAVTGLTTNLISLSYGGSAKFTLNSTGNVVQTSGAAGTTGYSLGIASLTSGKGLQIFSSSNAITSGNLLDVGTTGTTGSVAFTGDIAKFSDVRTFTSGVGLSSTGHALDVSRAITLNNVGNTHTISGALVTFSDNATQTAGTLTHTANVLSLTQSYASASGAVLAFSNSGTGVDILGTSSTWQVTKAGLATFAGINSTPVGATVASTGKFSTLTSTGVTDLANTGASNVTIATTGTGTVAIGNATGTFALTSSGGLNVTTAGALTGVASLDTITTTATAVTFAGAGTLAGGSATGSDTAASALTLAGGRGTGVGNGGNINFQIAPPAAPNQSFITGANAPAGVAVNATYVYWVNNGTGNIGRANLDGTGANQSFITGASTIRGIAIDSTYIYWANAGTGNIGRANLDGTGVNQSFITGASFPLGIAVDSTYIYWGSFTSSRIGRANLDGTSVNQNFITTVSGTDGVAVNASFIYWSNLSTNKIGRANLDGTSVNQSFITGASTPRGLTIDGTYIYWANSGTNAIARANLDGTGSNLTFVTGASTPYAVAVSSTYVYWANFSSSTIGRLAFGATSNDLTTAASISGVNGSLSLTSTNTTGLTTSSALSLSANSLTTGTGLYVASSSLAQGNLSSIASTSTTQSSGKLLNVDHTATYATTVANSGNLLNLNRTLASTTGGALTTTGAVAAFASTCTVIAGSCTDSANILSLTQSYASASGAVLAISNSGTGVDILGSSSTWQVSKAGAATFAGVNSGSGLVQGTGGLTITGTTSINASTNSATSIGAGTSNALVSIGGGLGTFALDTTNIDISAGAITGATGITTATGNVAITAGALTLNGTTRIDNAGVGTFITGTVIGSQTFTTNNIVDSGALTIQTTTTGALTLDSGTTGTINIGTGASGKAINIATNNTLADTIAIGSALDSLSLTGGSGTITLTGLSASSLSTGTNAFTVTSSNFSTKSMSTNFGGLALSGAFISNNSYWGEEFTNFRAGAGCSTSDAVQARGGNGSTNNCSANTGDLNYDITAAGTAAMTATSVADAPNGLERLTATPGGGGTAKVMEYLGAAANDANLEFNSDNLPVITMKVKPSINTSGNANSEYFVGLGNVGTAGSGASTAAQASMDTSDSGAYFTNCTTPTDAATCTSTAWVGVLQNGASINTVTCSGTISTSQFAYMRIEVITSGATPSVKYYVDNDVSDGISETLCGTITGTDITTLAWGWFLSLVEGSAGSAITFDVDYVRVWQDDAMPPETSATGSKTTTSPGDMVLGQANSAPLTLDSASTSSIAFNAKNFLLGLLNPTADQMATFNSEQIDTGRITAGLEIVTPRVTTKDLTVDTITPLSDNGLNLELGPLGKFIITDSAGLTTDKAVISFDNLGNASFNGTITADKIVANQIVGLSVATSGSINQDANNTALEDLSTRLSAVENQLTINMTNGVLETQGLTVLGSGLKVDKISAASAAGEISLMGDVSFLGRPYFANDTAGFAKITKGQRRVQVTFDKEYVAQPIVNASISISGNDPANRVAEQTIFDNKVQYVVTDATTKGFVIVIDKDAPTDIQFSWTALAVKDAKAFSLIPVVDSTAGSGGQGTN